MFDRIAAVFHRLVVSTVVKIAARRAVVKTLEIQNCWLEVRSCLVCWPGYGIDIKAAELVFDRLRDRFPDALITTVALPGIGASPPDIGVDIIEITKKNISFFGLPKRPLRQRFRDFDADIALDLSPNYNPLSAYICLLTGAKIKISFAMPECDLVFNYQVAPRPERTGLDRYRVLARYIG